MKRVALGCAAGLLIAVLACPLVWAADPAIVFVDEAKAGAKAIMVMDADGSNRTEVFRTAKRYGDGAGGPWLSPSISPDGGWVTYVYEEGDEGPGWAIWRTATAGGAPQLLLCSSGPDGLVVLETPQWSPDGTEIAAMRKDYLTGVQSVVIVPADGLLCGIEQPEVVYSSAGGGLSPGVTWSPNGANLAFLESDEYGIDVLTIAPRISGVATSYQIAWPPGFLDGLLYKEPHALDWQRAGSLVFALDTYSESATEQVDTVWLLQVTGSIANATSIVQGKSPTWSPDDSQLLFGSPLGLTRVTFPSGGTEFLGSGVGPDWKRGPLEETCIVDTECDDSNPCTADSCTSGECLNLAEADGIPCGDYAFCRSGGCFEAECGYLDLPICDDLDGCTVDSCDDYRCFFEFDPLIPGCEPVGGLPGDPCTTGADCLSGLCHPKKKVCK